MNFFFGIKTNTFSSKLNIPKFQNRNITNNNINLYQTFVDNNHWKLELVNKIPGINEFFFVDQNLANNTNIFFLATKNEIINFCKNKLINLNNFTDTDPAFRSNLQIFLNNGGFSSYQSEYPYDMINKQGDILSSVSTLLNKNADNNYLFFKNIYFEPHNKKFKAFFLDIKSRKILDEFELKTNYTNEIKIHKELIKPEVFFLTKNYLGIPMFVSEKKKHLSFEHTHPPHEYILSNDKFIKVSELKREINEIIG